MENSEMILLRDKNKALQEENLALRNNIIELQIHISSVHNAIQEANICSKRDFYTIAKLFFLSVIRIFSRKQ